MKQNYESPDCQVIWMYPSEILCNSTDRFIIDSDDDVEF